MRGGEKPNNYLGNPCFRRLGHALESHFGNNEHKPSKLDLAVLIRQVLRFNELQTPTLAASRLWVPSDCDWPDPRAWSEVGVETLRSDRGYSVRARPWIPEWLADVTALGVDAAAAAEKHMREVSPAPGDPFIQQVSGWDSYLTPGQRLAVRSALCTPPGGTLIVCLPTGDGKSFVFQLVGSVGYGDNAGVTGVTLVITPTVALALDHQRAAEEMGISTHRTAYIGGMPQEEKRAMIDRIKQGTQGLLFTAPESACGRLFAPLLDVAKSGLLRAIVVDEAHLIDSWGANFRPSFQVFSGFRKELLEVSPPELKPRTLLLSATLTNSTIDTLCTLFPRHSPSDPDIQLASAAQLRPEIQFWVAKPTNKAERRDRVIEALMHLPRPAILYVTEVKEAELWHRELRLLGFKRVDLLTGRSSTEERNRVVKYWREEKLDLVVGTSAFGLGIDNPHVRSVIHACIPETLDRFYQEVGRGGRDGRAVASLVIPFGDTDLLPPESDDFRMARRLNGQRLLTVERGYQRWQGMFHHQGSQYLGDGVFRLRVDGAPGLGPGYIDMVGSTNTEWNVRTLTLMANAGLIELLGPETGFGKDFESIPPDTDEETEGSTESEFEQYQRISINNVNHLDPTVWEDIIGPHRNRVEAAYRNNLRQMISFLRRERCAADTLVSIYELDWPPTGNEDSSVVPVATACGGCPNCRARGTVRESTPAQITKFPWAPISRVDYPASELLDYSYRVVVFYDHYATPRILRRWAEAMARLVRSGVRNMISLPGAPVDAESVQRHIPHTALFASNKLPPWDLLPPGPVAIVIPAHHTLPLRILRHREASDAHFIFLNREAEYPEMPGVSLRSRFDGPQFDLSLFIERINS